MQIAKTGDGRCQKATMRADIEGLLKSAIDKVQPLTNVVDGSILQECDRAKSFRSSVSPDC
ncbi:MAG: hypothetical protein CFE32_09390 [Alphaproteobacteria bacterium PA3]|nr:MAG: hypothetical protein CFE32_09390 [Alphaproteobacteria bacterium PA3]